jgi:hypothetical protein
MISCQREIKFDPDASTGEIPKGAGGACQPFTVSGNYAPGASLDDGNFVDISVYVKQAGTFNISTQKVNGYSFQSSGTFTDTGLKAVRLAGAGKPDSEGNNLFTVNYSGSSCNFNVEVNGLAGTDAVFTLVGAPGDCMVDSVSGNFYKRVETDTSEKISIKVNVTGKGAYSILTEDVNGYYFAGSGVFTTTGEQSIVLYAEGVPEAMGTDVFTVNTGTSQCTFEVTVKSTVEISSESYFPLTSGSYWSYEDLTPIKDTMLRRVVSTAEINDEIYTVVEEKKKFGDPQLYNFRQFGSEFYEFGVVDKYTQSLSYTPVVSDEIFFLNQVLVKGASWESKEYTGTIQSGQTILLKYGYYCYQKNITIDLNGNTFGNVHVIGVQPQIRSVDHGYNNTGEEYIYSYAKGIGLVYMAKFEHGNRQMEWRIKDWRIK